jgi:hypothetical protein
VKLVVKFVDEVGCEVCYEACCEVDLKFVVKLI